MKSIYFKTDNDGLIGEIGAFCQDEGFQSIDLSREHIDPSDIKYGFIVADARFSNLFQKVKVPIAFVGDPDDYNTPHYILDENAKLIHIKSFIDSAMNGGVIANISSNCRLKKISYHYEIGNDIFSIDKIVYNLTKDFVYFFKISDLQKIRIGLSEMITNAIEHGNLEITGEEKFFATENDSYYDLLNQKLQDSKFKNRKVNIFVAISQKLLKITIKDKGKGFDTSKIKKEHTEEDLYKLHGRGILIASMYFDEINYNKKGNVVELIKKVT
ncbi:MULTISPECIES: ATP-binding protein [Calditerrivibrio]|uniref:Histidine kinase/HSP90-like ATPase domain-containing protein n=1 Tax=Calditerrivibrio nitroreducens TaxID=477976 RepID=A0A2J6WPD2_9BACT|nr:MAG: hypothetical protein C0187_02005 [Calditerrivibrio nitroreducens]